MPPVPPAPPPLAPATPLFVSDALVAPGCEPPDQSSGLDADLRGVDRQRGSLHLTIGRTIDALVATEQRVLGPHLRQAEAGATGDDPPAQRGVAPDARCRDEIALGSGQDLTRELLVRGHPLGVGMEVGIHHDVEPGFEFIVAAQPDLDPGRRHALVLAVEGQAEHVLERYEPVAPSGQ